MDGIGHSLDIARDGFSVAVGKEGGNAPLMHPRNGIHMQPGLALARRRVVIDPCAECQASSMMTGTKDQDIALAEPYALGSLDRFEFLAGHGFAGFEPV